MKAINGLAGLAILSILFDHASHDLFNVYSLGWIGLDLLFILLGFILFAPHADELRTFESSDALWTFYWQGFLRIMPLYFIAVAVELLVKPNSWTNAIWLLSGLVDLHPTSTVGLSNWALWVVGIMIIYGIIFPAIVWTWRHVGPSRLAPIIISIALTTRIIGYLSVGVMVTFVIRGSQWGAFNANLGILAHLDAFVLGMLLAHMRASKAMSDLSPNLIWLGLAMTLTAWGVFEYIGPTIRDPRLEQLVLAKGPPEWLQIVRVIMINVLDIGLALIVAAALPPARLFSRCLSWAPLQIVGIMSYSIYIWHIPILHLMRPSRTSNIAFVTGLLLYLIVVLIVAAISYRLIESFAVRKWWSYSLLTNRIGATKG